MSAMNLLKSVMAPMLGSRKWGTSIDVGGGNKRDPGVDTLAQAINEAINTGGATDIYEPVKLRWHGQGPLFQIEDVGGNGQALQFGRRDEGFTSLTLGIGIESDGLMANNLVATPWNRLTEQQLEQLYSTGGPRWFTRPGGPPTTNVGLNGTGGVGHPVENTGGGGIQGGDGAVLLQLLLSILNKTIGGCCDSGEAASGSSCLQQFAAEGFGALQGFSAGAEQNLTHETSGDGGCLKWVTPQTLCEMLEALPGYDVSKKQAVIHDGGTCQLMDIGPCSV